MQDAKSIKAGVPVSNTHVSGTAAAAHTSTTCRATSAPYSPPSVASQSSARSALPTVTVSMWRCAMQGPMGGVLSSDAVLCACLHASRVRSSPALVACGRTVHATWRQRGATAQRTAVSGESC